jgi:cytoskeletal protein RodZ
MRQGLDISEAETFTKIRAKYLRALENDEFSMLPGSTYVKSFLRTYAEYLGLDAQLLVEEYRAQHEPRGEGEMQAFAPAAPAARTRERRGPSMGPPFGPGSLLVAGVVLLLVIFAVIGLASGGNDNGKKKSAKNAAKKNGKHRKRQQATAPAPTPKPTSVKLKVIPSELTYVCIDDGKGNRVFEGTITDSQSFRGKRLRINLGRASASLYVNGKRVRVPQTPAAVGYSFTPSGRATPLPPGQRPCA